MLRLRESWINGTPYCLIRKYESISQSWIEPGTIFNIKPIHLKFSIRATRAIEEEEDWCD